MLARHLHVHLHCRSYKASEGLATFLGRRISKDIDLQRRCAGKVWHGDSSAYFLCLLSPLYFQSKAARHCLLINI